MAERGSRRAQERTRKPDVEDCRPDGEEGGPDGERSKREPDGGRGPDGRGGRLGCRGG